MTNTPKIESKLAFDKIRESIVDRCSTGYGRDRAGNEAVSKDPAEIERRLGLTDEMRVILMFETSFPTSGYPDSIPFLVPREVRFHYYLPSLVLLRTAMDTLLQDPEFLLGMQGRTVSAVEGHVFFCSSFPGDSQAYGRDTGPLR